MGHIRSGFFTAAQVADYNTSHYWEFPQFQDGMLDLLNRKVTILNRIMTTPATGYPSRWKEQTKLPHNAGFVNVRTGRADGKYDKASIDEDYGRVERVAYLKCLTSQIKYNLFDKELVAQQGNEAQLLEKDMNDMFVDFSKTQNNALWNGAATSAEDSTSVEYSGILTQVTNKIKEATPFDFTTKSGTRITDAIRKQIAQQQTDLTYDVWPTAVYANPLTIQRIEDEELSRDGTRYIIPNDMVLENGWKVDSINTAIGKIPIIPDPYIKLDTTTTAGKTTHTVAVVNESLIERHYLTTPVPRIFKMSLDSTLIDDYIALLFDCVVVKGGSSNAHFLYNLTI